MNLLRLLLVSTRSKITALTVGECKDMNLFLLQLVSTRYELFTLTDGECTIY